MRTGKGSPKISADLIDDCRFCANRIELIARLPRGGAVAEIGTWQGEFARHILKVAAPHTLHLHDLDFSRLADDVRHDARIRLHEGASAETIHALPDASMDWIYIDGDHSYAAVVADAAAAATKVRPGGYLVFNDFAHADPFLGQYGLHRAVVEFALREQWPFVFLAYEANALYDVALRRPE